MHESEFSALGLKYAESIQSLVIRDQADLNRFC